MPKSKFVFIAALVIGFVLRVVWLDRLPIGFTPDEAALGYNAYSLLITGRDEWAQPFWQLFFTNLRSFGDYKPPLYPFLAVPAVRFFGLHEFSVRLPSAVLGTLSIAGVFLLTGRLVSRPAAVVAALAMAVSPWSIQMSRMALEANLVTVFLPLAIYAWISRRYAIAVVMLVIGFYSYHSARLITLLVLPLLTVVYPSRRALPALLLAAFLLFPGLYSLTGQGSARGADVAITNPTDSWTGVADRRFTARISGLPDVWARAFSNKVTFTISEFTKNYLSYLSPQFLFTSGAGESTYGIIPGRGLLYYIELPLLAAAMLAIIKRPSKSHYLLLALLLVSLLPPALAKGPGYAANRAAAILPFLMALSSAGLMYLHKKLSAYHLPLTAFLVTAYSLLFAFFLEDYVYHSPRVLARGMNYGVKEAVTRALQLTGPDLLQISRSLSEPHIYLAFYQATDPIVYQKDISRYADFPSQGYKFMDQLGDYSIAGIRYGNLRLSSAGRREILVGRPGDFPAGYPEHFHLDYPDGTPSITVSQIGP